MAIRFLWSSIAASYTLRFESLVAKGFAGGRCCYCEEPLESSKVPPGDEALLSV
jgi:hypothetical protein